ncbi:aminotransferase class V-fold PLP-dependent enzyme [Bordetella genomosp. 13]|uniref:aminotransferase class V-fold PLP-dependent enzyme n=1 Tax=Bordetella genomosp. 13 TaxID=463040 RepID=UPI0011A5C1E2|nr:aminotransferase class V-fold PLP-dependent enzyme [Bordetella genomosp. 13]
MSYDIEAVRAQFPVTRRFLYFDIAHQSPLAACVRAALEAFMDESQLDGGPKPLWLGRVPGARQRAATLVGARPDEIAFVKNTSEGLNIAANALPLRAGDNVLLMAGDHPNNTYAWLNLRRRGVEVRFVACGPRGLDAAACAAHADARTRAVAVSHVTSDTGLRMDLAGLGAFCRDRGIPLVVDAIQSLGIHPMNVRELGISMLAAGCHKGLLLPQGLGLLYVARELADLQPAYLAVSAVADAAPDRMVRDGAVALRPGAARFEIGNLSLPHVHALDAALAFLSSVGVDRIARHVQALGERLASHLDDLGVPLRAPAGQRSHIHVLDLPGEGWGEYFSAHQVRVSPQRLGVRVSLSLFNTVDEVDQLAALIRRRL